jgi:TonB family protein
MAQKSLFFCFVLLLLFPAGQAESHQRQKPEYPKAAVDECIEGYVIFRYEVDDEGRTANIKVIESSPKGVFEESVIYAVKYWRYGPKDFGKEFTRSQEFATYGECTPIDQDPNK